MDLLNVRVFVPRIPTHTFFVKGIWTSAIYFRPLFMNYSALTREEYQSES